MLKSTSMEWPAVTPEASDLARDIGWVWYKGQKYELTRPGRRFGRWAWVAHLETGETLRGKAFREQAAIANAKRAIKKALKKTGHGR